MEAMGTLFDTKLGPILQKVERVEKTIANHDDRLAAIEARTAVKISLYFKEGFASDESRKFNDNFLYTSREGVQAMNAARIVECSWKPEFKLTVKASQGEALVAKVNTNATIEWMAAGASAIGTTAQSLE
ncbi:unnamed protein product [Prorocentrum cordatum]|uniref:Uncharacterized protein n=1 Tax=Prorocentrum cordatum TaxID=2364126 RepID=A0ABN9VYF7_9DINO|nr:unnamed protein product [Polarella glacialis]